MAKILRSKKVLNQPTDPVFFHLGDWKHDIFLVRPKDIFFRKCDVTPHNFFRVIPKTKSGVKKKNRDRERGRYEVNFRLSIFF